MRCSSRGARESSAAPAAGARGAARGHLPALVGGPVGHPLLALESLPLRRTEGGCPACGDTYLHSVQPSPGAEVRLGYCPACAGVWVPDGAVVALHGLVAASPLWDVPSPGIPVLRAEPASPDRDAPAWDRFDYDVPLINGLAVPIAFLFGLLVHAFGLSRFCVDLLVSMPLHELGHATMAWFGGHYAMPLPFITFSVTQEKSFWVALALGALLMAGLLLGLRERRRYLVALSGAGLVLQLGLTLLVPGPTAARMITWSGCAGELVWPTLLLVSFHYRLPDRIRWDFWRYVALLFGACAFVHAMARWQGGGGRSRHPPGGHRAGRPRRSPGRHEQAAPRGVVGPGHRRLVSDARLGGARRGGGALGGVPAALAPAGAGGVTYRAPSASRTRESMFWKATSERVWSRPRSSSPSCRSGARSASVILHGVTVSLAA